MSERFKSSSITEEERSKGMAIFKRLRTRRTFCLSGRFRNCSQDTKSLRDFITAMVMASHGDTENGGFFASELCVAAESGGGKATIIKSRRRLLNARSIIDIGGGAYCCGGWNEGTPISLPAALVRCGWIANMSIKTKRLLARILTSECHHVVDAIESEEVDIMREREALDRLRKPYLGMYLAEFRYIPKAGRTAIADDLDAFKELRSLKMLAYPHEVFTGEVKDGLVLVLSPPSPPAKFLKFLVRKYDPSLQKYKEELRRSKEARSKMAKLRAELMAMDAEMASCS